VELEPLVVLLEEGEGRLHFGQKVSDSLLGLIGEGVVIVVVIVVVLGLGNVSVVEDTEGTVELTQTETFVGVLAVDRTGLNQFREIVSILVLGIGSLAGLHSHFRPLFKDACLTLIWVVGIHKSENAILDF
jgi:hypothetical protein